ncbi:hypothetical protein ZZ1p0038 [Acinetobacter phage ZZ1]|uniref:Uncharacterized protein n=2 Tax=Zedzedvirus zz1 TaxID=2843640 RepID=A0A410T5Q1_9CAUD|nr:hypothetical protein ZZ1p0038 [Acinetobacter phage ZZ1]AFL47587.1 hypothetical protein ZZ1p0038 [Acinetobacter phage ZZ1]QAU04077.1 hypothetical protein Henu6_gp97 [Acinetobacter phage Henu6]
MKCVTSMLSKKNRKCIKLNADGSATLLIQLHKSDSSYSNYRNGQMPFVINSPSSWRKWSARDLSQMMRLWTRKYKCTYVEIV